MKAPRRFALDAGLFFLAVLIGRPIVRGLTGARPLFSPGMVLEAFAVALLIALGRRATRQVRT